MLIVKQGSCDYTKLQNILCAGLDQRNQSSYILFVILNLNF